MASGDSESFASFNRRLRGIFEQNGMEYGGNTNESEELTRRFRVACRIANNNITKVMRDIKQSKSVDLCFVIDATASMRPHIEGVRNSIFKVVETLKRNHENQVGIERLRFAVVAYRDFDNPEPFTIMDFSESPQESKDFVENVIAFTGPRCDVPEDVFGGLEKATQMSWASDSGTRIIFHMGDDPCHGRRYQSEDFQRKYPDNYPDGDPRGRTATQLFRRIKELKVDYYFGKITQRTDVMIDEFCIEYGKMITTFDVEQVANIAGSVIDSIATSVETKVQESKLGVGNARVRSFQIAKDPPDWSNVDVQTGEFLVFDLPSSIEDVCDDKPLIEKVQKGAKVKVARHPFAEGSERIAYFGLDMYQPYNTRGRSLSRPRAPRGRQASAHVAVRDESWQPTKIVLKEFKHLGKKQNTLERYKAASEVQTVAFFMADQFNEAHDEKTEIKFLKTKTLILKPSDGSLRLMSCEREFLGVVDFVKFTNNVSYSMDQMVERVKKLGLDADILDLVGAFSHWTYHVTNGFFMIVDLQGCVIRNGGSVKILMTDPAIHCKDTTRYSPLNMGTSGMQAFFDTHRCRRICRQLRLPVTTRVP